jgi:dihydroneopterin aldolase
MMDKIIIEGLQLASLIGVYDWERKAKTRLLADVTLLTDLSLAANSDLVADTINYADVAQCLVEVAEQSEFELLEALADAMIQALFKHFPVSAITLKLSKPDILANAQNVAIELTREVPK